MPIMTLEGVEADRRKSQRSRLRRALRLPRAARVKASTAGIQELFSVLGVLLPGLDLRTEVLSLHSSAIGVLPLEFEIGLQK